MSKDNDYDDKYEEYIDLCCQLNIFNIDIVSKPLCTDKIFYVTIFINEKYYTLSYIENGEYLLLLMFGQDNKNIFRILGEFNCVDDLMEYFFL